MLIAHASDLHLDGTARARDRTARVLAHIRDLDPAPQLVVITGDITDHARPEEYGQAARLFAGTDVLVLPGNHDRRRPMRDMIGLEPGDGAITQVHRRGGATVVLADSTVPGRDEGYLADDSRIAIEHAAGRPDVLIIALHHPPITIGSGLLDPIRLHEPERLTAPLAGRRDPTLILCGHAHTAVATDVAGVPVRIAPGVASTLRLSCEARPDTVDREADPGLALHEIRADGTVLTHVRTVR